MPTTRNSRASDEEQAMILILKPLEWFNIVRGELRLTPSLGQYMMVEGTVRSELVNAEQEELRRLAALCEELKPSSLYTRYANRKVYRHEKDFWNTTDAFVKSHVKQMADKRVTEAVWLAHQLDIPILYAKEDAAPLHLSERLQLDAGKVVTPVMNFHRHEEGTTYQLQLRIDGKLTGRLSEHQLIILTYMPGMLALDGHIYTLTEGFSGKLLLPFSGKNQVEISRKMENDYFRRFILKHVAHAEINAEGFDITDIHIQPNACLTAETAIDGKHLLVLCFKYGDTEYKPDNKMNGRVSLTADEGSFRFVRQMRDRQREKEVEDALKAEAGAGPILSFPSLGEMIDWLRRHAARLKEQGIDVIQPSDKVYHIGPLSVEQQDTWQGDWLQTNVTIVIDDGRLRIPFSQLRDTILRGEQEYLLPSGELLLIPQEWLQRYASLLLTGMPKEGGFQRHRS